MKKTTTTTSEPTRGELALLRGRAKAQLAHESVRAQLAKMKKETDQAVAMLQELRVQHAGDGHFVNNVFVPAEVSRRDVELAFRQSAEEKKR
jgi:hypothetical protein